VATPWDTPYARTLERISSSSSGTSAVIAPSTTLSMTTTESSSRTAALSSPLASRGFDGNRLTAA
jgi:hypothetical protein